MTIYGLFCCNTAIRGRLRASEVATEGTMAQWHPLSEACNEEMWGHEGLVWHLSEHRPEVGEGQQSWVSKLRSYSYIIDLLLDNLRQILPNMPVGIISYVYINNQ